MTLNIQCSLSMLKSVLDTYVHGGVDFGHSFVVQWELVNLDAIADQFTHDFDFELVQLTLTDRVSFGNDRDDVHLWQKKRKEQKVVNQKKHSCHSCHFHIQVYTVSS